MLDFSVLGLTEVLNRLLPEPHAGLLSGLLFGTKATLSKELYNQLVITGTIHIIALSGMNISILMSLVAASLQTVIHKRVASLVTIGVIVWFVFFVGPSATIVRAAIMGSIALLAIVFGRQKWALLSLIGAVGVMVVLNSSWITDVSFQLSVLATLGIIIFGQSTKIANRDDDHNQYAKIIGVYVKQSFHLTLAAQVFTVPLIFFQFHRLSLIAPFTNVAIGWVIAPVTTLGWIASIGGFLWLPLGIIPAWMSWVLLEYLVRIVQIFSLVPYASVGF